MDLNTYQIYKDIIDHWMHKLPFNAFKVLVLLYVHTLYESKSFAELKELSIISEDDLYEGLYYLNNEGLLDFNGDTQQVTTTGKFKIRLIEEPKKEYTTTYKPRTVRSAEEGWIYIIHDFSKERYKIGKAKHPSSRLSNLKTYNPETKIYAQYKSFDYSSDERKLHKLFKDKHVIQEWFNLDVKDLQMIAQFFS
jgi:hypothetical protein